MKGRPPRGMLERRRQVRARVRIVDHPQARSAPGGSVTSKQVADVTLPRSELERIWNVEYLERLARTYWLFLTRVSLGLLRVLYTPDSREIVLLRRPFRLISFRAPEYDVDADRGTVTWPIERGILVSRRGRGKGYLRISVERHSDEPGDDVMLRVSAEVANFYPTIAASWLPGVLGRFGSWLYRVTQLRIHVIVTNAFLRSLAELRLAPSVVGALRAPAELSA